MFDQLFKSPSALARHRHAPYAEERARYLRHCAEQGYTRETLLLKARELVWVARRLSIYPSLRVTPEQLRCVADDWKEREGCPSQPRRFIEVARPWLKFLGRLIERKATVPNAHLVEQFAAWMLREQFFAMRR